MQPLSNYNLPPKKHKMKWWYIPLGIFGFLFVLGSIANLLGIQTPENKKATAIIQANLAPTQTGVVLPTNTSKTSTNSPQPTVTEAPTYTPGPTNTPLPTSTPTPTTIPLPTNTIGPTSIPLPTTMVIAGELPCTKLQDFSKLKKIDSTKGCVSGKLTYAVTGARTNAISLGLEINPPKTGVGFFGSIESINASKFSLENLRALINTNVRLHGLLRFDGYNSVYLTIDSPIQIEGVDIPYDTTLPTATDAPAAVNNTALAVATTRFQTDQSSPCLSGQIKGNINSHIFHAPGQQDYAKTKNNVQCFDTNRRR